MGKAAKRQALAIRYNGHMDWWDKDWPLYAAAVAVPIAIAVAFWFKRSR